MKGTSLSFLFILVLCSLCVVTCVPAKKLSGVTKLLITVMEKENIFSPAQILIWMLYTVPVRHKLSKYCMLNVECLHIHGIAFFVIEFPDLIYGIIKG